jgi:hypothetical protein
VLFVANGVQAEILLFLNDHASVTPDSFEPRISATIATSALKSMATARAPLLKSTQGRYCVNPGFKRTAPVVNLPRPIATEVAPGRPAAGVARDETVDAHLVRLMKGRRILPVGELTAELRRAVADFFPIENADIRQRINHLVSRGFLEVTDEGNVVYLP